MSQLRTITLVTESGSIDCLLRLSNYDIECKRIKLSLVSASGDEILEISCNSPIDQLHKDPASSSCALNMNTVTY
jgi:hypothetical protein